jgi:uncharacterized membrane protein YdjX (TVP38/TMEM64 family)
VLGRIRIFVIAAWLLVVIAALYLYFFRRDLLQSQLQSAFSLSAFSAGLIYFLFGCVRGLTLIPSAYLVFAAIPFLPRTPLLILTLLGILISSSSIYFFSEEMRLDEFFERKHKAQVARVKAVLQRNELAIIIGWSFFPLAPTDIICYVCGALEVDFKKFLLGIFIGEGSICAIYIFLGDSLLRFLHLRP